MKNQRSEIRSQRSETETETSYQVEVQRNGQSGWEQVAPVIASLSDAVKALRYHTFFSGLNGNGDSFRLVKTVRTIAALLILFFSLQPSATTSAADTRHSTTITCPSSRTGRGQTTPPAEPYITRHDIRATNFDQAPGPGLREDLRMAGETWPFVKFGPVKAGKDGRYYIFVHAHRSAWVAASDLPECIRLRFGITGKK